MRLSRSVMDDDDDDILIREHDSSSIIVNRKRGLDQEPSSPEDGAKNSAASAQPNETRRERNSSSRRRGDSAKDWMANATQTGAESMDSQGDDNAFAALATMLNFHDEKLREPNSKDSLPDANTGGNSPSSLSSVSASLDSAGPFREETRRRGPRIQGRAIPIPSFRSEENALIKSRTTSTSKPSKTKRSRRPEDKVSNSEPKRKKIAVSHSFRSIVGSRPKHWDRPESTSPTPHRRGFSQAHSGKRQVSLAAAVTASFRRPKSEQSQPQQQEQATSASKRSLIPSFLPKLAAPRDAIQEAADRSPGRTFPRRSSSPKPSGTAGLSPIGSPPERTGQHKKGPIAKRLQSLRDETRGDLLRLQSGQYPFCLNRSDRNDPRNRASSICDITILGTPTGSGKLVTALSYIHNWERSERKNEGDSPDPHGLAWASFAFDTASQGNLVTGSELRVYNAAALSLEGSVQFMIMCTHLSEPYPSQHLKALSTIELRVSSGDSIL